MTNAEKFKTAKERSIEFNRFCTPMDCAKCVLKTCHGIGECRYAWLDLEYKDKEELKPCPFCGGTPVMADNVEKMRSLSYFVRCACGARTVSALSESVVAEIWNRRAK
jgi:Lar family restriction alleviation protein